jgi:hypothetical protein
LILDLQVKLINGNETNIFTPQDWMKKFIEDQEQHMQQSESQPAQLQVKSMHIIFS